MCFAKNKAFLAKNSKAGRHSRFLGAAYPPCADPLGEAWRTRPQHPFDYPGAQRYSAGLIAGLRTRAVNLWQFTRPVKCARRDCEAKGVNGRSYGTIVDAP